MKKKNVAIVVLSLIVLSFIGAISIFLAYDVVKYNYDSIKYNQDGYPLFAHLKVYNELESNSSKVIDNVNEVREGDKIAFRFVFNNFAVDKNGKANLVVKMRLINPRGEIIWDKTKDVSEGLKREWANNSFLESTPYIVDDFIDSAEGNKYPTGLYRIEASIRDNIKNVEVEESHEFEKIK